MRSMRFHFKCTSIDFSMRTKCKVITMSLPIICWIAFLYIYQIYPTNNYLIEVENWNNRTLHEICSEVTTKTSERHLSSILLTWDFKHCSVVSTVNSVQANASWIYNKEFQKKNPLSAKIPCMSVLWIIAPALPSTFFQKLNLTGIQRLRHRPINWNDLIQYLDKLEKFFITVINIINSEKQTQVYI